MVEILEDFGIDDRSPPCLPECRLGTEGAEGMEYSSLPQCPSPCSLPLSWPQCWLLCTFLYLHSSVHSLGVTSSNLSSALTRSFLFVQSYGPPPGTLFAPLPIFLGLTSTFFPYHCLRPPALFPADDPNLPYETHRTKVLGKEL